jgi:hypothetical protein
MSRHVSQLASCLLYMRLTSTPSHLTAAKAGIAVTAAGGLASIFTVAFQCRGQKPWAAVLPEHCIETINTLTPATRRRLTLLITVEYVDGYRICRHWAGNVHIWHFSVFGLVPTYGSQEEGIRGFRVLCATNVSR